MATNTAIYVLDEKNSAWYISGLTTKCSKYVFSVDKLLGLLCVCTYTTNTEMLVVSCQCICNWFTDSYPSISLCNSAVALNSNNHAPCCSV